MSVKTVTKLQALKAQGEKITCLTAYDASMALQLVQAGVDCLMVGDSLGMVVQGHRSTIPVSMDHMVYHSQNVRRGAPDTLVIVDLPFMSYASVDSCLENAARLIKEGGADVVKLEGGYSRMEVIEAMTRESIPVCGHLGLLPQSVNKQGGYRIQGREEQDALEIREQAQALEEAGADMIVLECVPTGLARTITDDLAIPTIGIGAGPYCDGQVLVSYDLLGLTPGQGPRFVKNFLAENADIPSAISAYVRAVKELKFPGPEHSFE